MRSTACFLALSSVASATKFLSGPAGWSDAMGFDVENVDEKVWQKRHGLVEKRQEATPPARQVLQNRNPHIPGAKSIKIRYGPYTVPGAKVPGGEGMITNRPNPSVDKPCQNCYLLGMNAGLEYPDGKDANTDTLMWLHHMVLFNIGKGANDATCTIFGAPHLIVGSMPQSSERFFSSGNERTTTFFTPPWGNVTNIGYPIYPADRFGLIIDLMNMNMQAKPAYLTIYYDYVEGHPKEFNEVKPVWMDAAQCGTSEVNGRTANAKFDFSSPAWTANFEGELLGAGGHLHDGGTELDVLVDGKVICKSMPTYGTDAEAKSRADMAKLGGLAKVGPQANASQASEAAPAAAAPAAPAGHAGGHGAHGAGMEPAKPAQDAKAAKGKVAAAKSAAIELERRQAPKKGKTNAPAKAASADPPAAGSGHSHAGGKHIIAMSICADNVKKITEIPITPLGIKDVKKGQKWTLRAYYDYNKFPGMKAGASERMSSVMGISIMYVRTAKKRVA